MFLKKKQTFTDTTFLLTITISLFFIIYLLSIVFLGDKGFGKIQMFFNLFNERLIVKKAHASNHSEHALSVPTKDGDYLTIESLINKNGKLITANDYINSMFS